MNQNNELTQYMYQVEQYKEQISQLEYQSQYLQAAAMDYNKAKITLKNLEKADKKIDMLLPLGGGTYINANSENTKKVLVDIGSGFVTEKTYKDAIIKIDERIQKLEKSQEKVNEMINQIQSEAEKISAKAQKLMENEKQ